VPLAGGNFAAAGFKTLGRRGISHFAQPIAGVADIDASQGEQNTTYCGSSLTCTTESAIFASAVVNGR
jgi:hypothetical protein